jgi:hypothetical protein
MVRLHCGDGPLRPDLVGLRDSVSALCADNERLERLLEDAVTFRSRHPLRATPADAAVRWSSGGCRRSERAKRRRGDYAREKKLELSVVWVAPQLSGPRRCIGKAGKYSYSLDSSWQRWAKHMVSQGIVAPRSGLVQYWAEWGMHAASYHFLRLRVYGRLRALKATARGFIMRNAMRRWRQHACDLHARAQELRSMHIQSAANTFRESNEQRRWWRQLVAGCTKSRHLRQTMVRCVLQMRNKLAMLAIREWKAAVDCARRYNQHRRLAGTHARVAMLRHCFGRWAIHGANVRAEVHWWRTCLLRWRLAHSEEVHRQKMLLKLQELLRRTQRGRLDSILRAWNVAAREQKIERVAQRLRTDKLNAIGRRSRARCIQAKWRDYRERKR